MGWYARTNARMMAKRAGDDVKPENLERYRSEVTASRIADARGKHRAQQDEQDRRRGEKGLRKEERKERRKGRLS